MGNAFCYSCSSSQDPNEISTDIIPALEEMGSIEKVEELIDYIDRILRHIAGETQGQVHRPNSVASSIISGGNLIEKLSKRLNRHVCKKCLLSALDSQTRKAVIDVLKDAEPIPCLGMALSVAAHLLERAEQASSNKEQCLNLLRYMSVLAKHIKNLETLLDRPKLDEILCFIVKGTLMCALLMQPNKFCRFIFVPLDAVDLEDLKSHLLFVYPDLALEGVINVANNVTELSNTVNEVSNNVTEVSNNVTELSNTVNEVSNNVTEVSNNVTQLSNTVDGISSRLPYFPGPSQGEYPLGAVGLQEAQNAVTKLLDLTESSLRVVAIYGVGGIGKTTLATAVFKSLDPTCYDYCRVDMDQNCRNIDLQAIQEQILTDVFRRTNMKVNNCTKGREKLSEAFGNASKPVFLFIDNALRHTDVEKLLPMQRLSGLPMGSRILLTTRSLEETRIFQLQHGIQVHSHRVDSLREPEDRRLLCHYALGDENGSFDAAVNMEGLLQLCEGIPLVIKIVGSKLRTHGNTVSACNEVLEYFKKWQTTGWEGGDEDLSESIVDFVYNRLKEPCRDAFLDIVFFFNDWEKCNVADIVGEMELRDLEEAALITCEEVKWGTYEGDVKNTVVKMHDIVRARGRKLSDGNRITDKESLSILLTDEQKLQKTKGIYLSNYDVGEFSVEAKHVDLMSRSLRVLSLGLRTRVNGRCDRAFENLKFLCITYEDTLPVDLTKSRQLVCFEGHSEKGRKFPELPESLRLLHFHAPSGSPSVSLDIKGHLTSLREIELSSIALANFENGITQFKFMRSLLLFKCEGFTSIPESFELCSFLKKLVLIHCSQLERLPESFGNLSSLQRLNMHSCSMLNRLPESFGNLSSLKDLCMDSCSMLNRLPESFGNLSSLQRLSMSSCSMLNRLPESFGNLSSLQSLTMNSCSMLNRLTESFGNLSSLQHLYMGSCSMLNRLPESFGNLSSLQHLYMASCSMLNRLPESFGNLSSLQRLYMGSCSMLNRLPESFGNLSSLQCLSMHSCSMMEGLPQTFDQLSCLRMLSVDDCGKMHSLIDNFGQLKCLEFLSIRNCRELRRLPHDIVCLTSLTAVRAYGCAELVANTMDSLVKIKSLMFLEMGESPMLIKRWEEIQQHHPTIGAALRFEREQYPYEEIMSTMFFGGESRFLHVDSDGQLVEVVSSSFPGVGVKVGLLMTACDLSNELRQKLEEVASSEFQIIYVDAGVEGEAEGSNWMEERDRRIKKTFLQLPQGSRAWTSHSHKTRLLFAYSLWLFTGSLVQKNVSFECTADTSIVGTSVLVDEEGRRRLSSLEMKFPTDTSNYSRGPELKTLFYPLWEATQSMCYGV